MPKRLDLRELDLIHDAQGPKLRDALAQAQIAQLKGERDSLARAHRRLARVLADTQSGADLLGRRRLVLDLGESGAQFALVPHAAMIVDVFSGKVPFKEAVEAILKRVPVVAEGWKATRDAYEAGAFALARSSHLVVTRHVKKAIATAIGRGRSRDGAIDDIVEILGERRYDEPTSSYVMSYADTVFRTNTTSAYSEGRFEQAKDPEVAPYVGGFRFDATLDSDVRPNHRAANGFVAAATDPAWNVLRPPLGYNCRCALGVLTKRQGRQRGIIDDDGAAVRVSSLPRGARPDSGFRK